VNSGAWTLEPNAERAILLPWLDLEPDPDVRERVLRYLADLLLDPDRPRLRDDSDVYSLKAVPRTMVGLTWVLNGETREVVLAHVG